MTKTALCLLFVLATMTAKAQFAGGTGIPADPYIITTDAQLIDVGNDLTAAYRLDADITVSDWEPVGGYDGDFFTGVFDGNGHTVTINSFTSVNPLLLYAELFTLNLKDFRYIPDLQSFSVRI